MEYKKKIKKLFFVSLVLSIADFLFVYSRYFEDLYNRTYLFYDLEGAFISIFFFSAIIVFLSFILFFLHEQIFLSWWKFTGIYLPVVAVLILISPGTSGGLMPIDAEIVTWWLSGLFLFISLVIIAVKSWKLRNEAATESN